MPQPHRCCRVCAALAAGKPQIDSTIVYPAGERRKLKLGYHFIQPFQSERNEEGLYRWWILSGCSSPAFPC